MKPWQNLTHFENPNDIANEMVKKYRNTILRIVYGERTIYAWYKGYTPEGTHIFNQGVNNTAPNITLTQDTDCLVEIPQFEKGYRQIDEHAYYIKRLPYRQFRKGLNSENTHINSLFWCLFYGNDNYFQDTILQMLEAPIPDANVDAGIQALQTGAKTYALSLDFAISHNHAEVDPKSFSLFFGFDFVGFVYPETKTIKVANEIFMQEIVDNKQALCPDYKLEV